MRTAALAIGAILVGSTAVFAQPTAADFRSTVSGVVAGGTSWDDEGKIGTGPLVGIRGGVRLFGGTFAEVSLDTLQHERTGRFAAEGRTLLLAASIVQRFGRARAQPYLLGGVTMARHSGTFGFPEDNLTFTARSTDAGLSVGGGVAVRVGRRFEAGPEARFLILTSDSDSAPAFASWVGGRFAMRF